MRICLHDDPVDPALLQLPHFSSRSICRCGIHVRTVGLTNSHLGHVLHRYGSRPCVSPVLPYDASIGCVVSPQVSCHDVQAWMFEQLHLPLRYQQNHSDNASTAASSTIGTYQIQTSKRSHFPVVRHDLLQAPPYPSTRQTRLLPLPPTDLNDSGRPRPASSSRTSILDTHSVQGVLPHLPEVQLISTIVAVLDCLCQALGT